MLCRSKQAVFTGTDTDMATARVPQGSGMHCDLVVSLRWGRGGHCDGGRSLAFVTGHVSGERGGQSNGETRKVDPRSHGRRCDPMTFLRGGRGGHCDGGCSPTFVAGCAIAVERGVIK